MKLAVIEAEWHTEPPPAGFNVIAFPDQENGENTYALKIPYALGIIATRSLSEPVIGIHDLVAKGEARIRPAGTRCAFRILGLCAGENS